MLDKMNKSYEQLGKHLTDLKLEHRDGKKASQELDQLLGKMQQLNETT